MSMSTCDPSMLSAITEAIWICCHDEFNLPEESVPVVAIVDTGRGVEVVTGAQWARSGISSEKIKWYYNGSNRLHYPVLAWLFIPPFEAKMDRRAIDNLKSLGRMTITGGVCSD